MESNNCGNHYLRVDYAENIAYCLCLIRVLFASHTKLYCCSCGSLLVYTDIDLNRFVPKFILNIFSNLVPVVQRELPDDQQAEDSGSD